ncbi:hypothetical protein C3L23_03335 [Nautilia sp. PV-1]|uniref:dual OB domain-containing protein n=1 Tax=Nautilia sp. PV-1 TaxID=2579250 RepID=UPI000FD82403|nr:hypothetical protein [Nautilia sp. PV-1]AZV46336.1 hypothetical protein C3L23_03335 [Nautilia sp. PV-1]
MEKKVIFVASSVKHSENCVAVIDIHNKKFYRIVADKNGKEIIWSDYNILGYNCIFPIRNNLPFLAKIKILKEVPLNCQPENVIIDKKIEFINEIDLKELENFVYTPKSLWGKENYIKYDENLKINYSLFLIKVNKISLYWKDRGNNKSLQRRGKFIYNNITYDLPLTDPDFEYLKEQVIEDVYLVVSLGEPFNGNCYKIIAKVFVDILPEKKVWDILGL